MSELFGASISLSRDFSDSSSSDQLPPSGGALLTNNSTVVDDHPNNQQQLMLTTPTHRKPRGRPRGSKNKPKPPVIITRDAEPAMKPAVLDVPVGSCVIDAVLTFARRNGVGVSVMSASGSVAGVTLRQPTPHDASLVSLPGPFTILSLHGTFVAGGGVAAAATAVHGYADPSFGIVFAGAQGQVFGGIVAGRLVAASHVSVAVSTFTSPAFHRMGSEDGEEDGKDGSGGGGSGGGGGSEGLDGGGGATPMSGQMTRTHDVMRWASTHAPPAGY